MAVAAMRLMLLDDGEEVAGPGGWGRTAGPFLYRQWPDCQLRGGQGTKWSGKWSGRIGRPTSRSGSAEERVAPGSGAGAADLGGDVGKGAVGVAAQGGDGRDAHHNDQGQHHRV